MNDNLIANASFRICMLNCRGRKVFRGGKIESKNNTRCNSTKEEQVRKAVM